jgi:hypothetical protein
MTHLRHVSDQPLLRYHPVYILQNLALILQMTQGMPLYVFAGLLLLRVAHKTNDNLTLPPIWFFASLALLSWYDPASLTLNLILIGIPLYLLLAYCVSTTIDLFFQKNFVRNGCIVLIGVSLFLRMASGLRPTHVISWKDIQQDIRSIDRTACFLVPNAGHFGWPLELLFPDRRWIFFDKEEKIVPLRDDCNEMYYLDIKTIGLREEWGAFAGDALDTLIKNYFFLEKRGRLALYRLTPRSSPFGRQDRMLSSGSSAR